MIIWESGFHLGPQEIFPYQLYGFIGTSFSIFRNCICFLNMLLDIAVGLKSYCCIEREVFSFIKDSVRKNIHIQLLKTQGGILDANSRPICINVFLHIGIPYRTLADFLLCRHAQIFNLQVASSQEKNPQQNKTNLTRLKLGHRTRILQCHNMKHSSNAKDHWYYTPKFEGFNFLGNSFPLLFFFSIYQELKSVYFFGKIGTLPSCLGKAYAIMIMKFQDARLIVKKNKRRKSFLYFPSYQILESMKVK